MFFNSQIAPNEKLSTPFINDNNHFSALIDNHPEEGTIPEEIEKEEPYSLKNPKTGAIDPANIRWSASALFDAYAQNGVDQALHKKQDLIEWFENTLKMFESPQILNLKAFSLSKELTTHSDKLLQNVNVFQLLEMLKQDLTDKILMKFLEFFLFAKRKMLK